MTVKAEALTVTQMAVTNDEGAAIEKAAVANYKATYNGTALKFAFYKDAKTKLVEGTDYTVKYYNQNTDLTTEVAPKDAGNYVAVLTGKGSYSNKAVKIPFTIDSVDLSSVDFDDVLTAGTTFPKIESVTVADQKITSGDLLDALKLNIKTHPATGINAWDANGEYTFDVVASSSSNANIKKDSTGELNAVKVGKMNATFKYDGEAWTGSLVQTGKTADQYADEKVKAYNGDDEITGKGSSKTFSYTKLDGTAGAVTDIQDAGGTVTVKAYSADFECGGTATLNVTTNKGTVDGDASVYVTFDGEIVNSIETTYTSSPINPTVKVKKADGTVVTAPNADFKVTYYDADGKKMTTVPTDAGSYTLKVTSDTYKLANNSDVAITIKPVDLTDVKIADATATTPGLTENGSYTYVKQDSKKHLSDLLVIAYSGKDVNDNKKKDDEDYNSISDTVVNYTWYKYDEKAGEYKIVPASSTVLKAGEYKVVLKGKSAAKSNYAFGEDGQTVVEFSVADANDCTFKDVAPTDWFFKEVAEAAHAKDTTYTTDPYVKGIGDQTVNPYFAPKESMTRGQVAIVLFRMAGQVEKAPDATTTYPTKFTDVEADAYYAQAIQWASDAGIVTGFDGTTEFRPNDPVTREQFATMLARYAKLKGADITADEAALADYSDAANVSDWAKGYVAWAVEAGVMGKNTDLLWAGNDVSRAEVAAMAVRYQPRK